VAATFEKAKTYVFAETEVQDREVGGFEILGLNRLERALTAMPSHISYADPQAECPLLYYSRDVQFPDTLFFRCIILAFSKFDNETLGFQYALAHRRRPFKT
jgi:hypothetical protein